MNVDLLPCPFCGGEAKMVHGAPGCHFVKCTGCGATGDDGFEDTAFARWNRRALPSTAGEPVATDERLSELSAIRKHGHLERTSPKGPGQKFIGRCVKCGAEGLTADQVNEPCLPPELYELEIHAQTARGLLDHNEWMPSRLLWGRLVNHLDAAISVITRQSAAPAAAAANPSVAEGWHDVAYLMSIIDSAIEDGFDPDEDGPLLDQIRAGLKPTLPQPSPVGRDAIEGEPTLNLPDKWPLGTRVKVPDPTRTGEVGRISDYSSGGNVHVSFPIGGWYGPLADLTLWDSYRDVLGRAVRRAWVRLAKTQKDPKPSWLVPYDDLPEQDKEADRQIGESLAVYASPLQPSRNEVIEALEPFADFAANVNANGWTSNIHREPISTWFGPSAFRNALAARNAAIRSLKEGEAK